MAEETASAGGLCHLSTAREGEEDGGTGDAPSAPLTIETENSRTGRGGPGVREMEGGTRDTLRILDGTEDVPLALESVEAGGKGESTAMNVLPVQGDLGERGRRRRKVSALRKDQTRLRWP